MTSSDVPPFIAKFEVISLTDEPFDPNFLDHFFKLQKEFTEYTEMFAMVSPHDPRLRWGARIGGSAHMRPDKEPPGDSWETFRRQFDLEHRLQLWRDRNDQPQG